jgi:hypothetical protein
MANGFTQHRLLPLMPVLLTALLVTTTGCPSFHGKKGLISEAMLKDIHESAHMSGCPMPTEDWLKRCYEPIVLEGDDTPPGCTPAACLPDSSKLKAALEEAEDE